MITTIVVLLAMSRTLPYYSGLLTFDTCHILQVKQVLKLVTEFSFHLKYLNKKSKNLIRYDYIESTLCFKTFHFIIYSWISK